MGVVPAIFDADGTTMLGKSFAKLVPTKLLLGVACAAVGLVDAPPGLAVFCAVLPASALASASVLLLASAVASAALLDDD
jgi:hypothetical protein